MKPRGSRAALSCSTAMYFDASARVPAARSLATTALTASTRSGLSVHVSLLPRSIELRPIRHELKRKSSRYLDAMSMTARLADSSYASDWANCHFCGRIGNGVAPLGRSLSGTSGISIGVGFPIVSVNSPIMLWKYTVVRRPPFHHVEYGAPVLIVVPGFPSRMNRLCIAAPTRSIPAGIERIEVVVERIAERRREQNSAGGSSLVVIVDDLRMPRAIENAVYRLRFRLRRHEGIAVVVVADVLLVETRDENWSSDFP